MGDHFVLLVDRLLTESTLEAAIESRNPSKHSADSAIDDTKIDCSSHIDSEVDLSLRKMEECRICQDEDIDSNMETPCSCYGSLKYAHRRCVQRWCNEKGDTVCEICRQQFKPGYTAPPPRFRFGGIPVSMRRNWEIARRDVNTPRLITMVSTDRNALDPDFDEHETSGSRNLMCCRSAAIIFMVLLTIRHTLPVIANRAEKDPLALFVLLLLRNLGIILPIYVILRAVTALHHRRGQQAANVSSLVSSGEETGLPTLQHQHHVVRVH